MAMSLIGMERLKRKLASIPEAVKKRAQSDLMLAGREINMRQRAFVPVEDGTLRASIRTEPLTDGTIGVSVRAGGPATTKAVGTRTYDSEIKVGSGDNGKGRKKKANGKSITYDYALAQEYGTKDMPPNAFFWPGYRIGKKKAMSRARAGIRRAMREAAKNG